MSNNNTSNNKDDLHEANMNSSTDNHNVCIIGGGPVGIFAGFAASMLGLKPTIFEKSNILGGQCNALYPDKMIYDIPGIPSIKAKDLISKLEEQFHKHVNAEVNKSLNYQQPKIYLNTEICSITINQNTKNQSDKSSFRVHTTSNINSVATDFHSIIIAAGFGACIPNRISLPTAEKYENKQIFYNVTDDQMFAGKRVIILGGGNSAADWALHMCNIASEVTLIHRRDALTAFASSVSAFKPHLESGKLTFHNSTLLVDILENTNLEDRDLEQKELDTLTGIKVNKQGTELDLHCDYIIACYGMKSDLSSVLNFNLDMHKDIHGDQKILVDNNCQTSKPGIYAVGDIAYSEQKTKLFSILSGFYECTVASNHIYKTLGFNPHKLMHSSDIL